MRLNKEEMLTAIVLTMIAAPFPQSVVVAPFAAFLWALSGSESKYNWKLWRRLGVPLLWAAAIYKVEALYAVLPALVALSFGYGLPSTKPIDSGSTLGRFVFQVTMGNVLLSNLITRGLIYSGAVIPFLVVRFWR